MAVLSIVRCERFRCSLGATACATRHLARWPSGRRRGTVRFVPCGSCVVGGFVAAGLEREGWQRPPDSQAAEVLEPVQRQARDRWRRSFPEHVALETGELDPMREAALASPDDHGEPADGG